MAVLSGLEESEAPYYQYFAQISNRPVPTRNLSLAEHLAYRTRPLSSCEGFFAREAVSASQLGETPSPECGDENRPDSA